MKARFVHESVKFERSGIPMKGMDVGARKDPDIIEIKTIEHFNHIKGAEEVIAEEEGHEFLERIQSGNFRDCWWYALNDRRGRVYSVKILMGTSILYDDVFYTIPKEVSIVEGVNFERGKDPKSAMGIGIQDEIMQRVESMIGGRFLYAEYREIPWRDKLGNWEVKPVLSIDGWGTGLKSLCNKRLKENGLAEYLEFPAYSEKIGPDEWALNYLIKEGYEHFFKWVWTQDTHRPK